MNVRPVWKNVFASQTTNGLDDYFDALGNEFFNLYSSLKAGQDVQFFLTADQQDQFNQCFGQIQEKYMSIQGIDYMATIRRLGLIAYRFCMIFSALRIMETGETSSKMICEERDFQASLAMVKVLVKHSSKVFAELPEDVQKPTRLNRKEKFLNKLPKHFNRQKYLEVAAALSIPHKTAEGYITDFCKSGLLHRESQDNYTGAFNIIDTDGNYLSFNIDQLAELPRQPGGGFNAQGEALASAQAGLTQFGIDPTGPTGGSFLAAIIDSPTLSERWHQGGYVGYAITAVGAFAFVLAIYRLLVLTLVGGKVSAQLKSTAARDDNPLGRVLKVHEANPNMDLETLELKMAEAVLSETPKLESGLTLLKIIAAVAPLMGLLGTVTGMIITFQAITIFGAGDPKAMAGGISSALVTTVLGLLVAIPTVLLHTVVNGRSQRIIHLLNEQATGIVAEHSERAHN